MRAILALFAALSLAGPASAQLAIGSLGVPQPPIYTGAVASGGYVPYTSTADAQGMSRSPMWATDAITSLQVALPNFRAAATNAEVQAGATTFTASIEYPAGVCTRVTFDNGATSHTTNATSEGVVVSDPLTLTIPLGARFWVRAWTNNASGAVYTTMATNDTTAGEAVITGATVADQTMSCDTLSTAGGGATSSNPRRPLAVVGPTQRPSVCLMGASRSAGYKQSADSTYHFLGDDPPIIAPYYGLINLGTGGDRGVTVDTWTKTVSVANPTGTNTYYRWRGQMLAYCSVAVWEYGGNDFTNGGTAAAQKGYLDRARSLWPDVRFVTHTRPPGAASPGNAFDTCANQTETAAELPARADWNAWVRSGAVAADGYAYASYDMADVIEDTSCVGTGSVFKSVGTNTGFTRPNTSIPFMTGDGSHENNNGRAYIFAHNPIPAGFFCVDAHGNNRC